jgi:hypothetical protein
LPSTLSSASTDTQVRAALDDNASFEEDASTTKAQAYLTALRIWRRRLSESASASDSGQSIVRDLKWVDEEILRAKAWLEANGISSVSTDKRADFTRGRAI